MCNAFRRTLLEISMWERIELSAEAIVGGQTATEINRSRVGEMNTARLKRE